MLDINDTPELPRPNTVPIATDDLFGELESTLQNEKVVRLERYFAETPTPVVSKSRSTDGKIKLVLRVCPNKPEGNEKGAPCIWVYSDGAHYFQCLHAECKDGGYTFADIVRAYGPLKPPEPAKMPEIEVLTAAALDSGDYIIQWLIEDFWARYHPGFIGGPKKALKTSLMLAMAVSLATGLPFLDHRVVQAVKVLVLTGESGLGSIQDTLRRICNAHGISLAGIDNLFLSTWLPTLTDSKQLNNLETLLMQTACDVLFIDPLYLCFGGNVETANQFSTGPLLRRVGELCDRHGVTLVMLHHCRKRAKGDKSYEPPELDDLSWAGFAEYARQWALIGRREAYEPGSGLHRLWLDVGGSTGQSGRWAVDVNEGTRPRCWEISLQSPSDARMEKRGDSIRQKILDAARNFPAGETKTVILSSAKLKSDHATRFVFDAIVNDGALIECQIAKGNANYPGYKLPEEVQND